MRLAENGPGAFYAPDYFADYPPGYCCCSGRWASSPGAALEVTGKAMGFLICLWPILCDLGLVTLIWSVAQKRFGEQRALRFAAFARLLPGPFVRHRRLETGGRRVLPSAHRRLCVP